VGGGGTKHTKTSVISLASFRFNKIRLWHVMSVREINLTRGIKLKSLMDRESRSEVRTLQVDGVFDPHRVFYIQWFVISTMRIRGKWQNTVRFCKYMDRKLNVTPSGHELY
jgi:hypothetical protein